MKLVKKISVKTIMYFLLIFTVVVSVFPILWVIMSSFKTNGEIMSGPFVLPSQINFDAYRYLFENYDFLTYTINSIYVSFVPTILALVIYTAAAYVIAKYNFTG